MCINGPSDHSEVILLLILLLLVVSLRRTLTLVACQKYIAVT